MKNSLLLASFLFLVVCSACSTFDKKDLYGSWTGEKIAFTFNDDKEKTFKMKLGIVETSGVYRPFGNTIELVGEEGKVLFTITINSIKNDSLIINMPQLGASRQFVLTRQ